MRGLVMIAALVGGLLVGCESIEVVGVEGGTIEARQVQCVTGPFEHICPGAVRGGTPAFCGPDDDPDYFWIHVCGDAWAFECIPASGVNPERRILSGPCPDCIDGAPTCGEYGRPNCVPIPRDCAAMFYRGPDR